MKRFCALFILLCVVFAGCSPQPRQYSQSVAQVPAFTGAAYVVINDNQPEFTPEDMTVSAYETYAKLDSLGRCGVAMACLGEELMPTEDRESISQVKPSGWVQAQYDIVDGKNLYNRCHLIGFQLSGENANERNLITGTRFLNVEGMLPFENMVADYIKETKNHVLYRVTPVFDGANLVPRGVEMEAMSVEDEGAGILFHIYAYNNQPGIAINYQTGASSLLDSPVPAQEKETEYILNTNSKKFHLASCNQGLGIKPENREKTAKTRQELLEMGYAPAGCCNP